MIPSTSLGLPRVCLSSGVLGCSVPWSRVSLAAGVCRDVCVLVIRLQRLHLLLTVALLGLFNPLRKLLMQKHTHTHMRLVSGSLPLDLFYHHYTTIISTIL